MPIFLPPPPRFFSYTGLLFLSILGGLVGMVYLLFDPIVKHVILKNLILTNDTQFAEIWKNPPIAPHLKVRDHQTEKKYVSR